MEEWIQWFYTVFKLPDASIFFCCCKTWVRMFTKCNWSIFPQFANKHSVIDKGVLRVTNKTHFSIYTVAIYARNELFTEKKPKYLIHVHTED